MTDIAFSSAVTLAAKINAREVSSRELLDHYLDRVERFDGDINALVQRDPEGARAAADAADAALASGEDVGPLHGVPMTVKESYNVAGMRTTFGNPEYANNVAEEDALAVQRLKSAGAVIFGKTNVPISLADFQSYNDIYGTTNNPWDIQRGPGGSSGGSAAALAAGMTGLEMGSDIGGSIRNPAHYCGVFGHKPTWGIVPGRGHALPGVLSSPDIAVIGPLGRGAADLELAFNVTAGPDEIQARGLRLDLEPLRHTSLGDFKIAVWHDDAAAPVDNEVRARVDTVARVFADAGASVDFDARPDFTAEHSHIVYQSLLQSEMASRTPDEAFEKLRDRAALVDPTDPSPEALVIRSQTLTHRDRKGFDEARTHLRWGWHHFFQTYDLVLTPMMATAAFAHDHRRFGERTITVNNEARPYFEQVFWAGLAGVSFLPATVIPTGPNDRGLPIGVQLIGAEYADRTTMGAARLLEAAGFAFTAPPGY